MKKPRTHRSHNGHKSAKDFFKPFIGHLDTTDEEKFNKFQYKINYWEEKEKEGGLTDNGKEEMFQAKRGVTLLHNKLMRRLKRAKNKLPTPKSKGDMIKCLKDPDVRKMLIDLVREAMHVPVEPDQKNQCSSDEKPGSPD